MPVQIDLKRLRALLQQFYSIADSIVVGDLERTRLPQVKVLCLLGCNDGLIPRGTAATGILSEHDRTFLKEAGIELSPDARSHIFQQKTYLYMNLTRPSEKLWIYFSSSAQDGTALKPSFLVGHLTDLFPELQVRSEAGSPENLISARSDALLAYAGKLRQYAEGQEEVQADEALSVLATLHCLLTADPGSAAPARRIFDAAFLHYTPGRLSAECAEELYGRSISGSVTRRITVGYAAYSENILVTAEG